VKAVVLVGGEGTRMRPLTETMPKPLIPFMNRPFLHQVLDHLAEHGVDEAVLSSPYLEEQFASVLAERPGNPRVRWITESSPLGTGGAVAAARPHLENTFLVLNGDVLTDLDLTALVAFHREREAAGTIALTVVDDARPYGLVETDPQGRVRAFREKPAEPVGGQVNAGTYVLEPEVLDGMPAGAAVSIERETFPSLIQGGQILVAKAWDAYWRDVGTPASYLAAHADALSGKLGGSWERPLIDRGAVVDQAASVGGQVVVGAGARVAPGAKVERSVLHEGAAVEKDATVEDSIMGPGSTVGTGASVRDCVLGAGARVPPGVALVHERRS
jgi:mannose-1-phosphate guanylyltransferase